MVVDEELLLLVPQVEAELGKGVEHHLVLQGMEHWEGHSLSLAVNKTAIKLSYRDFLVSN